MFAVIRRSFALNPHLLFTSLDSPNSRSETIEAITKTEDPQVQSPYLNLIPFGIYRHARVLLLVPIFKLGLNLFSIFYFLAGILWPGSMHSYRCPWAFKWHLLIPINVQLAIPQSDRMVATSYSFSLKRSIG
jgi:hypothetical protein